VTSGVIRAVGPNQALTGGLVYRGSLLPLRGNYLYAIVRSGIFSVPAGQLVQGTMATGAFRGDLSPPDASNSFITSFTEDSQGETYYLNVPNATGDVYRIEAR
jgi:hypothetical protein